MSLTRRFVYLNAEQLGVLRSRVMHLLQDRGVRMAHPRVLKALEAAGAQVDPGTGTVKFPAELLEALISQAPRSLELFPRHEGPLLSIPREDGTFHTRTNTGAQSWIEPDSGTHRKVVLADVAAWARLSDRLEEMDFIGFPVPADAPSQTADVHALKTLLENTGKHVWVQPYTLASVPYLIELAAVAAGGESTLGRRPPVSFITCSLSPLLFKEMDLEIIFQCARRGIPLHACSLPGAGATAPVTQPGAVLLAAAEILAMTATAQVIQPQSPVIATPLIFSTDMRTGRSLQASVESMRATALAVQVLGSGFALPTHVYGIGTDSPVPDGQCSSEGALRGMLTALSGADILGGAGQMETATTISPVQLIIDNEVLRMVRGAIKPMDLDDEALAWDDLLGIEPGKNFLTTDHTFRHCRDSWVPRNFIRTTRESWEENKALDLRARARADYKGIMASEALFQVESSTLKDLENIVRSADRHLAGT